MACEQIKAKLNSLEELRDSLIDDLGTGDTPAENAELLFRFKRINTQIAATRRSLQVCLQTASTPPPVATPQNILEIQHNNPAFTLTTDLANSIAGGKFPRDSGKEWKQVLEPGEEYDLFLVGATGWVIDPKLVERDFPFSHPFDDVPPTSGLARSFDWEFALALDQPQDNPTKYTFLLAPGNSGPESGSDDPADSPDARARKLGIPVPTGGFLGVEWDRGHVPLSFRNEVKEGNRVAVFGRWILDCGHEPFRTEIHPPLLMAVASTQKEIDGSLGTRVLFTSRPYLVGQRYTVDTDNIYDDTAEDDGHFYDHLKNEIVKANINIFGIPIGSLLVEAHPKIKSFPFQGAHIAHLRIRPPSPTGIHTTVSPFKRLAVSFHFTVRSVCAVQITQSANDTVDVFISFSHAGRTPPPLPNRKGRRWSRDEINRLDPDADKSYLEVEALSAAVQLATGNPIGAAIVTEILERGIETDEYDPLPEVNVLDSQNAVTKVFADSIPAGRGVSQNDSQPYPIYGWLEVKWVDVADKI